MLILAWRWLENLAARFEITEERLIIRRGIISKSVDEIELYRIKDVRINFSLINQMAGIGTISITSSDETTRQGDLVIARHRQGAGTARGASPPGRRRPAPARRARDRHGARGNSRILTMGRFRQVTPFMHVPDIDAAVDYFETILGFATLYREAGYAYVEREGCGFRLLQNQGSDGAPPGNRRFAYYVDVDESTPSMKS